MPGGIIECEVMSEVGEGDPVVLFSGMCELAVAEVFGCLDALPDLMSINKPFLLIISKIWTCW